MGSVRTWSAFRCGRCGTKFPGHGSWGKHLGKLMAWDDLFTREKLWQSQKAKRQHRNKKTLRKLIYAMRIVKLVPSCQFQLFFFVWHRVAGTCASLVDFIDRITKNDYPPLSSNIAMEKSWKYSINLHLNWTIIKLDAGVQQTMFHDQTVIQSM